MPEDQKQCLGGFVTCNKYWEDKIASLEKLLISHMRDIENQTTLAKEAMELRVNAAGETFRIQLASIDEKARLLRDSMEHRLFGLNENRASLNDMVNTLVPRSQWTGELKGIQEALQQFRTFKDQMQAVATQKSVNISYIISIVAIFVSIVSLTLKFSK